MPVRPTLLHRMALVSFLLFRKNLGNLREFFGKMVYRPPWQKIARTPMLIDHFCYVIWRRAPAPWGSFRTPGRERLTADVAIMSMLYESTAILSVNGYLYLYQFIFVGKYPLDKLLKSFSIHTAVSLAIEWVFNSVSLAIETRYQNMAVMAVWRRRWKRHILVAVVNAVPMSLWSSTNLLDILHGRFSETSTQLCKMPFT